MKPSTIILRSTASTLLILGGFIGMFEDISIQYKLLFGCASVVGIILLNKLMIEMEKGSKAR